MDDAEAEFDEFVQARTHTLLRAARLLTGDQHLAEDLVQSALARTYLAWRRLHDSGNAEAYTRRVMYRLHVDGWRRRRVVEVLAGPPRGRREPRPEARSPDPADEIAARVMLRRALGRLTARQRAVLVLRFLDDLSERETAQVLDCSVGTVKSQTAKALAALRRLAPELGSYAWTGAPADTHGGTS